MANASAKRQAINNHNQLFILRQVSGLIYIATFAYFKVAKEHVVLQAFFALPGIFAQILLEKWCRPKYGPNKVLISPGADINQSGVIDYVKDVMLLTWFILLLSVAVGVKAWFCIFLVPAFVCYKAYQLLKAGKRLFSGGDPSAGQGVTAGAGRRNR